jgi:hypothetical protein
MSTRRPCDLSPSQTCRRTWILCSSSEKREPPLAGREGPVFDKYTDSDDDPESFSGSHLCLTITTTPQDRFVYWQSMKPSELLEYDSRLVAYTQELPFQEGKPLSHIIEEEEDVMKLVEYGLTVDTSPDRQVYMASLCNAEEDEESDPQFDDELSTDISGDVRARGGGAIIASGTRTTRETAKANGPRVATATRRCSNPCNHRAANTTQGPKAEVSLRAACRTPL